MAQNDMEIIVYKILSYLYECMKAGKHPRLEDMGQHMPDVPYSAGILEPGNAFTKGQKWSRIK